MIMPAAFKEMAYKEVTQTLQLCNQVVFSVPSVMTNATGTFNMDDALTDCVKDYQ